MKCLVIIGCLPKAEDEEAMAQRLQDYLSEVALIPSDAELAEFQWHRKVSYSNPGLDGTLNRYFPGLIEGNRTAVLAADPKAVS